VNSDQPSFFITNHNILNYSIQINEEAWYVLIVYFLFYKRSVLMSSWFDICGIDVERVRKNGNWCYDAWVKRLVCAIQACCYYQFSTNDDKHAGQRLLGAQHFFYHCSSTTAMKQA